ncbi:MAG TPA: 3-deoxy-7-phosphoheptulonate synthase [Clostridia bacterium]|nr:3-deoxy-7-phosphoheptulonate synthase [Clostridia bacterium]HRX43160.1 3-deoxy-7-phosphoheptulonate synthase [Clostridia bacterium]
MVIVLKPHASAQRIEELIYQIEKKGLTVEKVVGSDYTILGLVGDTSSIDIDSLRINEIVHKAMRIQEPFKRANRLFHPKSSIVKVGGREIGGGKIAVIAGPCSVETEDQIVDIARRVKAAGADFLRGGAFKPRTSPYSFQGLGYEGIELLVIAKKETGLPIVSEILSESMVDRFARDVDLIQVGARNMSNFMLLKELGKIRKPILLKRGLSATIEEWLMSAEYIMSEGNTQVILCERGIRTFEKYTRNTLDVSAVPAIKRLSHLPIIVDPSHATGMGWMVMPMARAAVAAGTDGIMIEVHNDPENALSDGNQSITPEDFSEMMNSLRIISGAIGRRI